MLYKPGEKTPSEEEVRQWQLPPRGQAKKKSLRRIK
jgi:hypothetical protein